jgi:hypothetical protein
MGTNDHDQRHGVRAGATDPDAHRLTSPDQWAGVPLVAFDDGTRQTVESSRDFLFLGTSEGRAIAFAEQLSRDDGTAHGATVIMKGSNGPLMGYFGATLGGTMNGVTGGTALLDAVCGVVDGSGRRMLFGDFGADLPKALHAVVR